MTNPTKILLAISLTAFAFGFTNILWGLGAPLGAVFFGLFLISRMLQKETSLFDEEQRLAISRTRDAKSAEAPTPKSVNQGSLRPASAHSH
jgi:hypothetical protein